MAALAAAAVFAVGIAAPNAIPRNDAVALGATVNRETLYWHGEATYTGTLSFTPGVRTFVLVMGGAADVPRTPAQLATYCGFIGSLLERYPQVFAVNIWGEPNPGFTWPRDLPFAAYNDIVRACAPIVHAHGALVGGPALHPYQVVHPEPYLATLRLLGHELDFLSVDPYWYYGALAAFVQKARAAFGWKVSVWVAEDGIETEPPPEFASLYQGHDNPGWTYFVSEVSQPAYVRAHMLVAYCAGVSVWLNFLLVDDSRLWAWNSGLEHPDGSPKPSYAAFAQAKRDIDAGSVNCASEPMPPSPPPHKRKHPNDPNFRGYV